MKTLFLAALAVSTLVVAPAVAQSPAARQTAELVAPAADAKFVGKGTIWRCAGTACTAPASDSRPAISCSSLVKQVGKVSAFTVGGVALDQSALERCNSFAR